jgi:DNA-3-methyladenine glycosylase
MNRIRPKRRLPRTFFNRPTLTVARELLGKRLVKLEEQHVRLSGIINETEAYIGADDLGCHARSGKTQRNAAMWGPPGHCYVYFTYGVHWMLNFVCEEDGFPAAVLIRGIMPQEGRPIMRRRRGRASEFGLTDGPAKLCQALSIERSFDGHDLCRPTSQLFVEEGMIAGNFSVTVGPRVGLNNVPEPWKSIPWRFRIESVQSDETNENPRRRNE